MKLTLQQIEMRAQAFEDAAAHLKQRVTDDGDIVPEQPGLEREQYDAAAARILRWSDSWYHNKRHKLEQCEDSTH